MKKSKGILTGAPVRNEPRRKTQDDKAENQNWRRPSGGTCKLGKREFRGGGGGGAAPEKEKLKTEGKKTELVVMGK